MLRIEKLTPEQIARFPEFVRRWTDIGLCTDAADRPMAEAAIIESYKCGGLKPPRKIVWCGSPLSQGLTRAIILDKKLIKNIGASVGDSVWASVWDSVRDSVGDSVRASVGASVGDSVGDSVWASVRASVWDSVGDSVWASVRASVWDSVGASVRASVWDSVGASVRDSVGDSVRASVWDSVWASVGASVRDSVGDSVRASVGDSVWASVWDSVRDSVWASVWDSVRDSVGDSVWASVRASVGASVRDSVGASVRASVRDSVGASVRASVRDSVGDSVGASIYGSHDAGWLAFYHYFHDAVGLIKQTDKLSGLWKLAESAGWALPHQNICWVSERHNILCRDDRGRLHSILGPACAYPDGWTIYAVHGVRVPQFVVERPKEITVEKIDAEQNAEIRRVMIERYRHGQEIHGHGAFILDAGGKRLDHDESFGTLWRREISDDEPIVMLEVVNATREPDGRFKKYWLRVPPTITKSHEAAAWTFNVPAKEYAPQIET